MLKDKLSVSVQVGRKIASDATKIAKTTSVKALDTTKSAGKVAVNSTVKATKVSTKFVADKASKIPEIGDGE
jgi:hypothetical protein